MNEYLESRWSESVRRLALGIEPTDPVLRSRTARGVEVAVDGVPWPLSAVRRDPAASPWVEQTVLRKVGRRDSGRHALLVQAGVGDPVRLRLQDPWRRYVPRRLEVRMPEPIGTGRRIRPALFPGAAYELPAGVVGMRGRVTRGGQPLRWARAEARRTEDDLLVGCAHGDEHGEILLILDAGASRGADLILPLTLRVSVFGPDTAPDPAGFESPDVDPLWDLPVEVATDDAAGEAVLGGTIRPAGYISRPATVREVEFGWSGLVREEFDFS